MSGRIPHLNIVVGACVVAVAGYLTFSIYVVFYMRDATMIGDVIGTWKSFAVGAFAFWIGASSGGKAQPGEPPPQNAADAARETADAADAADKKATEIEEDAQPSGPTQEQTP